MIQAVSKLLALEAEATLDFCLLEAYRMVHNAMKESPICPNMPCGECPFKHRRRFHYTPEQCEKVVVIE